MRGRVVPEILQLPEPRQANGESRHTSPSNEQRATPSESPASRYATRLHCPGGGFVCCDEGGVVG